MKESLEKFKINKLQAGGFMSYQPLPILPQQQSQEPTGPVANGATAANVIPKVIDEDTRKALLGKGITNDVVAFEKSMEEAYSQYESMGEAERMSSRGRRLRSMMKGNVGVLNGLLRSKDQFTEAIANAKSNAAFGELAVTSNYEMVVKDVTNGNISTITSQDYAKDAKNTNKRKYQALTVAELINEREYNQNLIGDSKSFEAINSTLGMTKIKDEIYQVLTTLSADSTATSGNQFVDGRNSEITKGIQQMTQLADQGVFDVTTTQSNENNTKSLQRALNATWQNLSENARSTLMARAAVRGVEPDKLQEEAQKYVMSLLSPKEYLKTNVTQDIKFDSDLSTAKGGMDGMGYYELFANGTPANLKDIKFNMGTGTDYHTLGRIAGPLLNEQGNPYGKTNVSNVSQLYNIGNMNSVYFGDKKVDPSRLESLVYDGGNVTLVHMPYKNDNGAIAPDLDAFEHLNKANNDIKSLPATARTAMAVDAIYKKYGVQTDGAGKPATRAFATFKAIGNDTAIKNAGSSKYLINESDGPNSDYVVKTYEDLYRVDSKGNEIERPEYDKWLSFDPDVISGLVYIPITAEPIPARLADKNQVNTSKSNTTLDHYSQAPGIGGVRRSSSNNTNLDMSALSQIIPR